MKVGARGLVGLRAGLMTQSPSGRASDIRLWSLDDLGTGALMASRRPLLRSPRLLGIIRTSADNKRAPTLARTTALTIGTACVCIDLVALGYCRLRCGGWAYLVITLDCKYCGRREQQYPDDSTMHVLAEVTFSAVLFAQTSGNAPLIRFDSIR